MGLRCCRLVERHRGGQGQHETDFLRKRSSIATYVYSFSLCAFFFRIYLPGNFEYDTIQETGAASQAVKAAQDVLKDIRMVFSEKSQKDKADKAAAKAAAVPKAKPGAKKRANGKQADV